MGRVFVLYSQLIRFARFDGKSANREQDKVLDKARALDPLPQARRIVGSGDETFTVILEFVPQSR